jgi:DNA-binding NtrC family response regulator
MAHRGRILVVDDEANARAALSELLREEGYVTETAADGFKALKKVEEFGPDVILTDLKMPALDGLELMDKVRTSSPQSVFVVMTAFGSIASAVQAVKRGAENYLTKPLDFEQLYTVVERAMEKARLLQETQRLREKLRDRNAFKHVVAVDPKTQAVFELVTKVGASKATVLITGESGTGKELVAEAIYSASDRADKPFVRLNCAALSESLLESELFGHERGAFTGAVGRREGRFKQADGGTLFLDEVGELSPATQVKLLRVLQEKTFERVGGNETVKVDVRLVAATHRDLRQEIAKGTFREDLFYRLNVITVDLPPLRERTQDILPLANFFLNRYAGENGKSIEDFSEDARTAILAHPWPGNVRELENAIERAVVLCDGPQLQGRHLPAALGQVTEGSQLPIIPGSTIEELERFAIMKTLEACGGSTSKAAMVLGVSTRKIQYKLHEYSEAPKSRRSDATASATGPSSGSPPSVAREESKDGDSSNKKR